MTTQILTAFLCGLVAGPILVRAFSRAMVRRMIQAKGRADVERMLSGVQDRTLSQLERDLDDQP
jgi:hypothetical protein